VVACDGGLLEDANIHAAEGGVSHSYPAFFRVGAWPVLMLRLPSRDSENPATVGELTCSD